MAERKYFDYMPFDRPKLPRNKYGLTDISTINNGGNSLFAGGDYNFSNNAVGGAFVDISKFTGATATEDGTQGLVPAPVAGQNQYFLQGSGAWIDIPAYRWLKEFPEGEGFEKTGLTINGDFNVQKTLSTLNLKVEGAAHFWSLIIDEVKAAGGQILVSPSLFFVDWVGEIVYYDLVNIQDQDLLTILTQRPDIYNAIKNNDIVTLKARRLYMRCDDGSKRIKNEVEVGDMLRCRTFNVESRVMYKDISNTDYWSFVVKKGEGSYFDQDEVSRKAFWIELAYSMKTKSGDPIPLGTVLSIDGSVTPIKPEGYSETSDILELKKVSQQVLTGEYAGQEEQLDGQELIDVQNRVIEIRGITDAVNGVSGRMSTNSANVNNLTQLNRQLAFISGEDDDIASKVGEENLAQLTVDGLMSDNVPQPIVGTERSVATKRAAATVNSLDINTLARDEMDVTIQKENTITIKEDTVTERPFILAEDVLDDSGAVIHGFGKGDKINAGVVIDKPITVIDNPLVDVVTGKDIDTGDEFVPDNLNEIDGYTDNTATGIDRDVDTEDVDYGALDSWTFGYGTFICDIGDQLACLGHLWNTDRQNAIVLSSASPIDPSLEAPAMAQYNGIDRFGESISKFRLTAIAKNGNEFCGSFLISHDGKYVDVNERIEMFITDLESGLEKVGIHLDGDNSTITLRGSVDLRQHSADNYDTLNVYDNLNVKRVEITPKDIPSIPTNQSDLINTTKRAFNSITSTKTATKSYISKGHHGGMFGYKYRSYKLENYSVNYTITANLGRIEKDTMLDLRNLDLSLITVAFLNGSIRADDRGNGKQQSVSALTYTLKKDGVVFTDANGITHNNIDLLKLPNIDRTGLNTGTINVRSNGAIADNIPIHVGGTFTLDIKLNAFLYVYYDCKTDYDNYYYKINTSLIGNITTYTQTSAGGFNDLSNRKIMIGNNGLSFVGNNSMYFYAATDGFKMLWDDNSFEINSKYGVKKNGTFKNISHSENLTVKDDVVIAEKPNGTYYYRVYLPPVSDYGVGRQLFISAFKGMILETVGTDTISYTTENGVKSVPQLRFNEGDNLPYYISMPKYTVTLCAGISEWYIMSYL